MIIVVDNYDSFVFNIARYLRELGCTVTVVRNDAVDVAGLAAMQPAAIVLSPGPCTPAEAGISVECIRRFAGEVPILGVCLGHQAIGAAFGAKVVRARRVLHGKLSPVAHRGGDLFRGLPSPFLATRYHSLIVDPATLPPELEVTAWTDEPGWEDEILALRHRTLPVWGVQFHPESIASEGGRTILANFLELR